MNTFMSLETGKRAIAANQVALSTVGHNISNANTAGYSRQVANAVTTVPWNTPSINNSTSAQQLGTGVVVDSVTRVRNSFVDGQIRNENTINGYWTSMESTLSQIEGILNEPTEDGLRTVMDQFWESWQNVSKDPESEAVRSVVTQRGMAMAEAFKETYQKLTDLRDGINDEVKTKAEEINIKAAEIADLNKQIATITATGKDANDLCDTRDLLIDEISAMVDINVYVDDNNMVDLQLGDRMLVDGKNCSQIDTIADDENMYLLVWEDTQTRVQIDGGELKGLLDARGKTSLEQEIEPSEYSETIPNMIDEINAIAKTVIVKTNELHRGGYSINNTTQSPDIIDDQENNFFCMPDDVNDFQDWAQFMEVSAAIQSDSKNIAAASSPTWDEDGNQSNFGDGTNALAIAQLKQDLNNIEYDLKTKGIGIDLDSADALSFIVDDGNDESLAATITINAPNTFTDMQSLVEAIQIQLDEKELDVSVRSDGLELFFYSGTVSNLEVINNNSGISDIQSNNLQNGEYQILTRVDQPDAVAAQLVETQHYNQRTAASIFGSGEIGTVSDADNLAVNASIELTVESVNTTTGEVKYRYLSHEYNTDGTQSDQSGTVTLQYGGSATQSLTIGSLTFDVTGLDTEASRAVAELKAGDKGVLSLTAATDGASNYQQVDIAYDYNCASGSTRSFIFNEGVLDSNTAAIQFFTLNDNQASKSFGTSYDGSIELTVGTLVTANPDVDAATTPAAHFSYYEQTLEDSGMVENNTVDEYWAALAADVGVQSEEAQRMVDNETTILTELENKRQAVSGVSLDEEATNMIKFQQAYNAAARFITVIDEALDTIINGMGVVGR